MAGFVAVSGEERALPMMNKLKFTDRESVRACVSVRGASRGSLEKSLFASKLTG